MLLVPERSPRARERWSLPWVAGRDDRTSLDATASRLALRAAGARAGWLAQAGAFGGGTRHPGGAAISVAYVGVMPWRTEAPPAGARWFPAAKLPPVAPRQRAIVDAALGALRERMDRAPVAFRLLGATFTLSELQASTKCSSAAGCTRRASAVRSRRRSSSSPPMNGTAKDAGRPAQLFRYAPRRRRGGRGGVRFDLLGG